MQFPINWWQNFVKYCLLKIHPSDSIGCDTITQFFGVACKYIDSKNFVLQNTPDDRNISNVEHIKLKRKSKDENVT